MLVLIVRHVGALVVCQLSDLVHLSPRWTPGVVGRGIADFGLSSVQRQMHCEPHLRIAVALCVVLGHSDSYKSALHPKVSVVCCPKRPHRETYHLVHCTVSSVPHFALSQLTSAAETLPSSVDRLCDVSQRVITTETIDEGRW